MSIVPSGIVHQAQLAADIAEAIHKLPTDEVSHVSYSLGTDATDDPSIFFRVVLTDSASREEKLADVTGRVAGTLLDAIHPIENWGLNPYFNFRSQTEQRKRNGPEWS
jgi:hypothetical protein